MAKCPFHVIRIAALDAPFAQFAPPCPEKLLAPLQVCVIRGQSIVDFT